MTGGITCLFAHPDDDTYGVGGTLARHAGEGLAVTVALATSGEAGRIADPSLATRRTLGAVREAEARASWDALAVRADLRFLRYPDGGVADVPHEDLVAAFVQVLLGAMPEVVVTFGPDGVTGHPDHVAVGEAATEAFHVARGQVSGGFGRLLHSVLSQERLDSLNVQLRARGLDVMDPTQPFAPRGVAREQIGVSVDCSEVLSRKVEALRCHKTQGELEGLPYELWPAIVGREEFHIAWQASPPPTPGPLADVFEAMPDP